MDFDPVHTASLHAFGGGRVIFDHAFDIPILHHLGKGAVRGFAVGTRRNRRQPVPLVPVRAAAQMGQLDHGRTAMFVQGIRQFADPRHDLVAIGQDVVEDGRTVAADGGGPRGHCQRHAAFRTLFMIGAIPGLGHPVFGIGRFVTCGHHPVLQGQMLELVGLKQGIGGDVVFHRGTFFFSNQG